MRCSNGLGGCSSSSAAAAAAAAARGTRLPAQRRTGHRTVMGGSLLWCVSSNHINTWLTFRPAWGWLLLPQAPAATQAPAAAPALTRSCVAACSPPHQLQHPLPRGGRAGRCCSWWWRQRTAATAAANPATAGRQAVCWLLNGQEGCERHTLIPLNPLDTHAHIDTRCHRHDHRPLQCCC